MIRQKISLEIDWDIKGKSKSLFESVQNAILNETLKSFTGIYQAKATSDDKVMLTVFKPSAAAEKNFERIRVMRKKLIAMKKKK